jgi:HSP20 family protein
MKGGNMSLMRMSPLMRALNRWPTVWEDDDLLDVTTATNNLDVYETEDEVVVKANVAGVPVEKVDVTFEKGVLWIKAEREEEKTDEERQHYSRSSWNYSYRVAVPGMIDYNQEPNAEVEDGVITVSFKKAEASKPKRLSVKARGKK